MVALRNTGENVTDTTILLIEDNSDDEHLTLRELKKNHIANEIVVARDGAEALEYLFGEANPRGHTVGGLPHLVLLDLNMPRVDGLDVLRRIRAERRTHSLPVIVLISSNEDSNRIKANGLGINGYVRKPVRFADFGEAVCTLGLSWVLLNPPRGRPESALSQLCSK